ncbi:MAG: hypothetical protein KAS32_05120 [Candidatus Peribacteraceae bacterium]|nr:hypothetical protein [Candidatus Peribacteraceae bacterium]
MVLYTVLIQHPCPGKENGGPAYYKNGEALLSTPGRDVCRLQEDEHLEVPGEVGSD